MPSTRNNMLQAFSTMLVVTVFLCQVIGSFCPMVPPGIMSETAIHDAESECPMGGSSQCMDSLPSSPKVWNPDFHQLPSLEPLRLNIAHIGQPTDVITAPPSPDSTPPLYIRLSTFRI
nr:hypothetical protein [Nitrospirota bacterium]